MALNAKDRGILRRLASQAAELAHRPEEGEKAMLWKQLNRLEPRRAMVYVWPGANLWLDFVPESALEASEEWARRQERELRKVLFHAERIGDDAVYVAEWPAPLVVRDSGWGMRESSVRPDHAFGSRSFETTLVEERDIDRIQAPRISVDREASEQHRERLEEAFGDILAIRPQGVQRASFHIMDDFIKWRGIEQTFLDLIERPAWIHEAMERMTQGFLAKLDQMEALNALGLNNRHSRSTSGGLDFTDELPAPDFDGVHVRTRDMWGHATTQIFSDVSPAMHDEFALAYERRYMARFGLNNYGCCEPLHNKIHLLRGLPNLRRISMSPWIDPEKGAAEIGRDFIFSYKPNPAALGAEQWAPEHAETEMRRVLEQTRGCAVELVLKDLHSCRGDVRRIADWRRIAHRLAEEFAA